MPDPRQDSIDRHPTALGRRLDAYLAGVAVELRDRGVVTGAPERTELVQRLVGTVALDCTAIRVTRAPAAAHRGSRLGAAVRADRPAPVLATWDEHDGWSVAFHRDPLRAGRRYLGAPLLPAAAAVADFVVGLARGADLGGFHPIDPPTPGPPQLRIVR